MSDQNQQIINAIIHYQQCIDKYLKRNNESKVLHCISKLHTMSITVAHLEHTGIGRTVNSLRKVGGDIADAAKLLVMKWKEMVAEDTEQKVTEIQPDSTRNEEKDGSSKKHREENLSSHEKNSDRKRKHSHNSSNSHKHSRTEHKKEAELKSDRKSKTYEIDKYSTKHTLKHDGSDNSSDAEREDSSSNNYKPIKVKTESEPYQSHSKKDFIKSSSKRKYESSEDSDEKTNVKHRKLSDNSCSDAEEQKNYSIENFDKYKSNSGKESKMKESHDSKEKREIEHKVKKESSREKDKHKHKHKDKPRSDSDRKDDDKKSKSSSKHNSKKHHKSKKDSSRDGKSKISLCENGIGSSSGASFAEALGMLAPVSSKANKKKASTPKPFAPEESSKKDLPLPENSKTEKVTEKKLEPLDINLSNLLPEITPNYRPLGNVPLDGNHHKSKTLLEDEALSSLMYSKISRTKVYSGNKVSWGTVSSLFDLCTRVLQDNIDALEYTGGVPYSILKSVLERANSDQLYTLEHYNAYLIDDTDELWQLHCQKEFRNKDREEMETWRDMYMRCVDEREAKLRALTANIKLSQDKSLPVRQTKLAYVDSVVKPPRSVARKQAKNGTGGSNKKPTVTPSSRLSALATAGAAGQIAVPNPGSRAASSGNSSATIKVKKAPLMQKTLAFMKNRCFRR